MVVWGPGVPPAQGAANAVCAARSPVTYQSQKSSQQLTLAVSRRMLHVCVGLVLRRDAALSTHSTGPSWAGHRWGGIKCRFDFRPFPFFACQCPTSFPFASPSAATMPASR